MLLVLMLVTFAAEPEKAATGDLKSLDRDCRAALMPILLSRTMGELWEGEKAVLALKKEQQIRCVDFLAVLLHGGKPSHRFSAAIALNELLKDLTGEQKTFISDIGVSLAAAAKGNDDPFLMRTACLHILEIDVRLDYYAKPSELLAARPKIEAWWKKVKAKHRLDGK